MKLRRTIVGLIFLGLALIPAALYLKSIGLFTPPEPIDPYHEQALRIEEENPKIDILLIEHTTIDGNYNLVFIANLLGELEPEEAQAFTDSIDAAVRVLNDGQEDAIVTILASVEDGQLYGRFIFICFPESLIDENMPPQCTYHEFGRIIREEFRKWPGRGK